MTNLENLPYESQTNPRCGNAFRYRLMRPLNLPEGEKAPLLVFLHGAGERGDDNLSQLKYLPEHLATPASRERYRCFVFGPQCRAESSWVDAIWSQTESTPIADRPTQDLQWVYETLDHLLATEQIDHARVYLTGLSMGGYGAWDFACRAPKMFAAVSPICGGGDEAVAPRLLRTPIWAWHGELDDAVPVQRSRSMVNAIRAAGGTICKYTELAGEGHKSWIPAYRDDSGLLDWMFSMRKPSQ
jgi:predicted peptidase